MAVRNYGKMILAQNGKANLPQRQAGVGPITKPEHNPEPLKGSRRLRPDYEKPKRRAPRELLVGLSQRLHSHPKERPIPGAKIKGFHGDSDQYTRYVPLTKARKAR